MGSLIIDHDRVKLDEHDPSVDTVKLGKMLVLVTVFLVVFGLTMLYSTSYGLVGTKYFKNQLMWLVLGGASATGVFLVGYRKLAEYSSYMMLASLLLLIAALFFPEINGAKRWIRIPGVPASLQPSELAKLALCFFTAEYCAKYMRTFNLLFDRHGIFFLAVPVGSVLLGIILGHDYGTTALCAATVLAILVAGGLYLRYIGVPLLCLIGVYFQIRFFDAMRWSRMTTFLNPEKDQSGASYQLWLGMLAIGSGSWTGLGFMESRLKAKYLPEAHTDFILAIVGEELGYLRLLAFVFLPYILFGYYGFKISLNAANRLGMLLGCGVTSCILMQALINISVIIGAAPTKGMPAPFISYGGSNLLMCLTAVGVLLSIAAESAKQDYSDPYRARFSAAWLKFKGFWRRSHAEA